MRRVAVVSRAGGGGGGGRGGVGEGGWGKGRGGRGVGEGGWGVGEGGGGACCRRYERLAQEHMSAHRLTHGQCWLQMLAKSIWRATNPMSVSGSPC